MNMFEIIGVVTWFGIIVLMLIGEFDNGKENIEWL